MNESERERRKGGEAGQKQGTKKELEKLGVGMGIGRSRRAIVG